MSHRLNRLPPLRGLDYSMALVAGEGASAIHRRVHYYGYARQALYDALRLCRCIPDDTVLYPETICDVTLEPAHRLGLRVVFYPVSDDLLPDWVIVKKMIAHTKAKVVMSVNYFGFPQPMELWRQLTQETKTAWINDNAHGYGSLVNGTPLEAFGDVSITSMRKVLPLINGASLQVNHPGLPATTVRLYQKRERIRACLPNNEEWRRIARSAAATLAIEPQRDKAKIPYERMPMSTEYATRNRPMGVISTRVFNRLARQLPELCRRRRLIYETWDRHCTAANLRPVFPELPAEVSPMVYPCYAGSFTERQKWLKWAVAKNVDVYPWPSLPTACRGKNSPAVKRWRRLLCFPIHPDMKPSEICKRWS